MQFHSFFASAPKGMEALLQAELLSFGATRLLPSRAGIAFEGTLETAYRACLHSRIANRVLMPLKTVSAPDSAKLYGGVKSIRWSDHLAPGATIAVDFKVSEAPGEPRVHTHFGALKTKDAICDQLREVRGERPSVDTLDPDFRVSVFLARGQAIVSLDLSGESLHRRGYRERGMEAPLKENLGAAVVALSGWARKLEAARAAGAALPAFLDPMCGSGTLPIEAALVATRTAPGLMRAKFGFMGWKGHDAALWDRLVAEARAQIIRDPRLLPRIVGYDADFRAVRLALTNVERAGLRGVVHVEKRSFEAAAPTPGDETGALVFNPPYGERLGEVEELKPLYKEMGDVFKKRFRGWSAHLLTSSPDLAKCVGLKTSARVPLFNGALECRLLGYEMYAGTKRLPADAAHAVDATALAARPM